MTNHLEDATPLLGDVDALRSRITSDGYLYFRHLLDPSPLWDLRRSILRTIAEHGWLEPGTDPHDARPSLPARAHGDRTWRDGYVAVQRLESFHRQAFAGELLAVLESIIGGEVLVHGQRIARIIWPQVPTLTTPAHQDYTHIQGTPDFFTCWVPLGPVTPDLGGLRILHASHLRGIRAVRPSTGAGGVASQLEPGEEDWRTADFDVGDVVMFHSLIVHGGQPNTTDRLRLSVDYRYQSVKDPVAIQSLRPHNCPLVPDWDELLQGTSWSSSRWATLPEGLIVRDLQLPGDLLHWHEELALPGSRYVPQPT